VFSRDTILFLTILKILEWKKTKNILYVAELSFTCYSPAHCSKLAWEGYLTMIHCTETGTQAQLPDDNLPLDPSSHTLT